jgi:hypothetical protein
LREGSDDEQGAEHGNPQKLASTPPLLFPYPLLKKIGFLYVLR